MNSDQRVKTSQPHRPRPRWLAWLVAAAGLLGLERMEAATNIVLWDAGSRFGEAADVEHRADWKAVPSEMFVFETEPAKAASDPGYYGREYSFKGDAVVENQSLAAVFWSAKGRVVIYSKTKVAPPGGTAPESAGLGHKMIELLPLLTKSRPGPITRCEILRNAGDEVLLEAFFSVPGAAEISAVFSFGRSEIVEIMPGEKMQGVGLLSPIEYGIVPGFVGDDLIFGPTEFAAGDLLTLPSENVFVGLLKGEASELVMTWPKGSQRLQLRLASDPKGKRVVESVDFHNDGQSLYLAVLSAPGLWHREELKPAFLEKDVTLGWKRPFAAKWKTQFTEVGVRTTFNFRESKDQIWRGVPGSYNYPVWFEGGKAVYHLSKKVPPKGESIVYFLEGQHTPLDMATPVDVIKATLGLPTSATLLDVAGRRLRTHHRRGGDGVHRACTCGCTEAIQAVFEAGQEVTRKDDVKEALADMNFFVRCHVERIQEYTKFAAGLIQFLQAQAKAVPDLKPFCDLLEQTVQQIHQEYSVQKENMKSLEHAEALTRQTLGLTDSKSPNNVKAYMELLKAWRAMGGAQDYVLAQCHTITRKLFQEAGYGCAKDTSALAVAQEVRARCRKVLRNPDGYEIWADY